MKKIILLFILFFCLGIYFSQQKNAVKPKTVTPIGYRINVSIHNLEGKVIKLSIYNGNYKQVIKIDSVQVKSNSETVTFKQNQKIIPTIYQMAISGKTQKSDIIIDNGSNLSFFLDGDHIENVTTENQLNKSFLSYQKMPASVEKSNVLKNLQQKYASNKALKYYSFFEERKNFRNTENKDSEIFREEVSKGIDFNDKIIPILPNSYGFLNNFFNFEKFNKDHYKAGVDILLKNQNCDSPNFKFYVSWIFNNLRLYQTEDIKDLSQYIFNAYVNNKSCIENQKKFYDATLKKSSEFVKLPVGSTLPDFEGITLEEQNFKLADFKKEKVNIMMFYDVTCEHCIAEVPKVQKEIAQIEIETGLKLGKIAVLNVPSEKSFWKDFVIKNHLEDWISITYKDLETQTKLDAFEVPKFYIFDNDGKIIYKLYNPAFLKSKLQK